MKKICLLLTLVIVLSLHVTAQMRLKGTVNHRFSDFKKGDTIELYGFKSYTNGLSPDFIYKKNGDYKKVDAAKITMISKSEDFWDQLWFYHHSGDVVQNAWHSDIRDQVAAQSLDFITNIQQSHMFYDDEYLRDYLLQLTHTICPKNLNKNKPSFFSIYILKSDSQECFSFDNGVIILSTAAIAAAKTEKDLGYLLARQISNVVLDYNTTNILKQIHAQNVANFWTGLAAITTTAIAISNNDKRRYNFTFDDAINVTAATNVISHAIADGLYIKFSSDQIAASEQNASNYLYTHADIWKTSPDDYTGKISGILTYTAWQKFYTNDFKQAMDMINRTESARSISADGYLLKAKIYRSLYITEESNYEALACLQKAAEISNNNLIDVLKEQGLIYLRLNNKGKAKEVFDTYLKGLLELQEKGENNDEEISWINTLISKNNL